MSGSLLFWYSEINTHHVPYVEKISFELISDDGAACDNMFMSSDNCNETPANCGEGGTGHGLSCSILCDSGSRIDCGSAEDTDPGEHASLIFHLCLDNS